MRFLALALLLPAPALAHPGHLAEVAGHGHWGAAITLGLAAAITLWAGLKGRKSEVDAPEGEAEPETDGDEAPT